MLADTYVDRNYLMDEKTEDLITSGNDLLPGMKVLIASPDLRIDISKLENEEHWREWLVDRYTRKYGSRAKTYRAIDILGVNDERDLVKEAMQYNRWVTILRLDLRVFEYTNIHGIHDHVVFIGRHDDGVEFKYFVDSRESWLVKKPV